MLESSVQTLGSEKDGYGLEEPEELSDDQRRTKFLVQIEISKKCAQSIDLNSLRELKALKSPPPIVTALVDIVLSLLGIEYKAWPDF